jgi:hypothetical protein
MSRYLTTVLIYYITFLSMAMGTILRGYNQIAQTHLNQGTAFLLIITKSQLCSFTSIGVKVLPFLEQGFIFGSLADVVTCGASIHTNPRDCNFLE